MGSGGWAHTPRAHRHAPKAHISARIQAVRPSPFCFRCRRAAICGGRRAGPGQRAGKVPCRGECAFLHHRRSGPQHVMHACMCCLPSQSQLRESSHAYAAALYWLRDTDSRRSALPYFLPPCATFFGLQVPFHMRTWQMAAASCPHYRACSCTHTTRRAGGRRRLTVQVAALVEQDMQDLSALAATVLKGAAPSTVISSRRPLRSNAVGAAAGGK